MRQEFFYTIEKHASAEYKDRGSRFLAYAFPLTTVQEFKIRLNEVKKDHPKSTHHCFAYRIGLDGSAFRVNDDGEPPGTAGKPILGQIDSRQLTNITIMVVRYFGGTLLGVPGLINAYKSATAMVLQLTPLIQKAVEEIYRLQLDYTQLNEIMTIIKQCNCSVIEQELLLFPTIKMGIPLSRRDEVLYRLKDIPGLVVEKEENPNVV